MKFLVTGGRGFIGSHFVEFCLSKGHKVVDIDKMTYASNQKLPWDDNENYTLIKEDIEKLSHLPLCDIIVNFAAESHVDNSINEPDVFSRSNILGTQNLLNLLRGKVYERPLFVHISTDEVYGDISEGDMTEESILNPSNPYSASKASAEMILFSYGRTYGIEYQICRSSNNYGPRQYPEKLIPKTIECLTEGKPIPIHGDGRYVRDWTYVKDNVEGVYKVCFSENKNQIWNISANNCLTNIEVVNHISEWMDKTPNIKFVGNRLGQDVRYSISSQKIRNKLGWKPNHNTLYNFIAEKSMNFILDNTCGENQIIDCLNEYGVCLVKDFFSKDEVNKLLNQLNVMYDMIVEGCHGYFYSSNNVELSLDKDYLSGKAMRIFPQYYDNVSQLLNMFVRNSLLNSILNSHFSPNCQRFLQVFSTRETKIVDDENLPRNSHMHIDPYESLKFAIFFQKTTKENGALKIIPGSFREGCNIRKEFIITNRGKGQYGGDPHRMDEFPEEIVTFSQNDSLYIDCDIGDLVILNTDNYHSGGTLLENSFRQALYVHNRP